MRRLSACQNVRVLRLPRLRDLREHLRKARPAVVAARWKVRAAVKRFEIGRHKHIQGPAARASNGLDIGHVDLVDIWALFAVHFDRDEMGVQYRGNRCVLERFALHHMAPMAGRIADAQEDRSVRLARPREGLLAPGIPRNGIMLVLEQVGGLFAREAVGGAVH